jgi:hypothetical protein
MTVQNIKPVPTQALSNVSAPYGGSVPSGVTWSITRAVFVNTDTVPRTITANCVAASGAPLTGNTMIPGRTLQPGETYVSTELAGLTMVTGDELYANASVVNVVTLTVSANQISNS